jgi:hypothetical protein
MRKFKIPHVSKCTEILILHACVVCVFRRRVLVYSCDLWFALSFAVSQPDVGVVHLMLLFLPDLVGISRAFINRSDESYTQCRCLKISHQFLVGILDKDRLGIAYVNQCISCMYVSHSEGLIRLRLPDRSEIDCESGVGLSL